MGKVKYLNEVLSLTGKSQVVTVDSIRKVAGPKYAHLLLHNLVRRKVLHRITRGCYSRLDDPTLAVFCFQPAYLGLENALSINNLWEQETNPIILTTMKIRQGSRNVFGSNVMLRRIPAGYCFGFEYVPYGSTYVPASDPEKTLIDLVYFRHSIQPEVLMAVRRKIDSVKLKKYLHRYESAFARLFARATGLP
ncbi:hypothetical protein HYY74_06415 [Candidatus Woesearchaeota archaeon]|nr:hypothetical protein [Candidatus Woesearchaeota archaeon]